MIMILKKKIKFYSEYPTITDAYPIYPAKEYKRKWVKDCATAFQKYKKLANNKANVFSAARCPGMRDIMENGYIVTTWCDITIETNKETPTEYKLYYPETIKKTLEKIGYKTPIVTDFNMKDSPVRIPTGNNQKHILKFWAPWCIDIPKGYQLMFMPVQYDDDPVLTACGGILSSGFNIEFNVHVFWHETNKTVFIPAGTPLCQLVPIKVNPIEVEFNAMSEKERPKMLKRLLEYTNKFIIR